MPGLSKYDKSTLLKSIESIELTEKQKCSSVSHIAHDIIVLKRTI